MIRGERVVPITQQDRRNLLNGQTLLSLSLKGFLPRPDKNVSRETFLE
jgi:hypothetical protein